MTRGRLWRVPLVAAVIPSLLYYAWDLLGGPGTFGVWHWKLAAAGLIAAALAGIAAWRLPAERGDRLLHQLEALARCAVAALLLIYAMNKLVPGQFLFYNRDLDLPLREVPSRRVAWHFLGYSTLYIRFMAGAELLAAALLCWYPTRLAGVLLSAGVLANVVAIDAAFKLPVLPIPATMLLATLVLLAGQLTPLPAILWRPDLRLGPAWRRWHLLSLLILAVFVGYLLKHGLGSRRGLMNQLPPAGQWEVLECLPELDVPLCQLGEDGRRGVLYLEVGRWGQLRTAEGRRSLQFTYQRESRELTVTVDSLTLRGTVAAADSTVLLAASQPSLPPFQLRVRRSHPAPWPPTGWAR